MHFVYPLCVHIPVQKQNLQVLHSSFLHKMGHQNLNKTTSLLDWACTILIKALQNQLTLSWGFESLVNALKNTSDPHKSENILLLLNVEK